MSRHSELFDRVISENRYSGRAASVETQPERRNPVLPIQKRLRSEIEKIVNRIHRGGPAACKVLVFTAFEPESGCSWVCAHSGDLLAAGTDASVCLVDANLRTPAVHTYFGIRNSTGLSDLIADPTLHTRSVASKLARSGLWTLTSGAVAEDTSYLVSSDRMRDRIAELRGSFDFVLIDAPAVAICNDAFALGQSADGVILVLRAGSTRRHVARRLTQELAASGVKVLGAILNDYHPAIPTLAEKWL